MARERASNLFVHIHKLLSFYSLCSAVEVTSGPGDVLHGKLPANDEGRWVLLLQIYHIYSSRMSREAEEKVDCRLRSCGGIAGGSCRNHFGGERKSNTKGLDFQAATVFFGFYVFVGKR